jgi:hypothetical protein
MLRLVKEWGVFKMDVLEYWHPNISWAGFRQGTVSERMWGDFYQLVQLCHAHGHWQKAAQDIRLAPPRPSVYGPESKYQSNSVATSGSAISSARKGTCIAPHSWQPRR